MLANFPKNDDYEIVNVGSLVNNIAKDDGLAIGLDIVAISGDMVCFALVCAGVAAGPVALLGLAFGLPAIMLSGTPSSSPLSDPVTFSKTLVDDAIPLIGSTLTKLEEEAFAKFTESVKGKFTKEELLNAFHQGWKVAAQKISLKLLEQREKSWLERIDNLRPSQLPHGDTLMKNLANRGFPGWTKANDSKPLLKEVVRYSFSQLRENIDALAAGQECSSENVRIPNLASYVH
ncbi:hypothetical protein [Streptomyces sp. H27-D2]|uniref:hypothetical protein n=1 Tax=Streptomyces sp. H27-D2 TaxID=3046304 RepID=UPI002DB62F34|nr:hypothetical protein [Streptomyces sp. H27-D2]MEC4017968.1 hypothetical protein [Streptomyces sp. H27-D2]